MARAGLSTLITRLRTLAADRWTLHQDTATADGGTIFWLGSKPTSGGTVAIGGTVSGTTNWSLNATTGRLAFAVAPTAAITVEYNAAQFDDSECEAWLDLASTPVESVALKWIPDSVGGQSLYHRASVPFRDLEEASSGTIHWRVTDSTGAEIGTAQYTPDYPRGEIRFSADTGGSALYLTARSYDLYAAAADYWEAKASASADQYRFTTDGQSFDRQQAHAQALAMAEKMRQMIGRNVSRGSVRVVGMTRTDLARW